MFLLHQSNRFETLAARLTDAIGGAGADPFDAPQVIVPSLAMRRALQFGIATREGICANVRFDYLAQWFWARIAERVAVGAVSPFAPARLQWRILATLADTGFVAAHPRLDAYLAAADPAMRVALARRLATLFDHYLTYRPDWLAAWRDHRLALPESRGEAGAHADEAWQAALWRQLGAAAGAEHRDPAARFFASLEAGVSGRSPAGPDGSLAPPLPAAIHVFALPAVPPLYLDMLQGLARHLDVHYYALNPCREFWYHVVDRKRLADPGAQAAHHETGNTLLAGWGRQAQAHLGLVAGLDLDTAGEDAWRPAAGTSLLRQLQDAVLEMRELEPSTIRLAGDDRSVEVHVCHSRTRELEVLRDRLLACFAADPRLRPGDIVVVCPDIDLAAPLIDAVFGVAPPGCRIPYAISGRATLGANPIARVLASLLALAGGRFTASAVYAILEQAPVAERYAMRPDDLERVRRWLGDAGVRWGDAATARHGFAQGMQRLFAAFAAGAGAVVAGTPADTGVLLAAGDPEGSEALVLGRLWHFVDTVSRFVADARAGHGAQDWCERLLAVLDELTAPDRDNVEHLQQVRRAIGAMRADMRAGGFTGTLPVAAVQEALEAYLEEGARGAAPGGDLRFVALGALRGLPYRIVCAIGLDDGAFPRAEPPLEFDLIARHPRIGDRQRRHDDRNVFLDLVLSARDALHLSYVGRSIRDDSPLPPSVLVDELLDYLAGATAGSAEPASHADARARLTVAHPLQAFSAACFMPPSARSDARLASFDAGSCAALQARIRALAAAAAREDADLGPIDSGGGDDGGGDDSGGEAADGGGQSPRFFTAALAPVPGAPRHVSIDALARFFRNPCRALLDRRLGIRLPEAPEDLPDDEAFTLQGLDRHTLGERLLALARRDADAALLQRVARASPETPDGRLGERAIASELDALRGFLTRVHAAGPPPPVAPRAFSLSLALPAGAGPELDVGEPWVLEGSLADVGAQGATRARFGRLRAQDLLDAWLAHLALCAARFADVTPRTRLVGRHESIVLPALDADTALAELAALVALQRDGMSRPLHFFPRSAWAYAERGASLAAARREWEGGHGERGSPPPESQDPAFQLALRGVADPLDAAFARCASTVFGTLAGLLRGQPA